MGEFFAGRRGKDVRLYIPRIRESTFGTMAGFDGANDNDVFTYEVRLQGDTPQVEPTITTDAEQANNSEMPIYQHYGERKTPATFAGIATSELISHIGALCIGSDSVSNADSTSDKLHSITRNALTSSAYGFSYQVNDGGSTASSSMDIRPLGNQVKRFRISYARTGFVEFEFELYGSGRVGTPGSVDETEATNGSRIWIPSNKCAFGIKGTSTEHESAVANSTYTAVDDPGVFANVTTAAGWTVYGEEVERFVLEWNNNLDEARAYSSGKSAGAGIYGNQAPYGDMRLGFIEAELIHTPTGSGNATYGFLKALASGSDSNNYEVTAAMEWAQDSAVNSNYRGGRVLFPLMRMVGAPRAGMARGFRTMNVRFETLKDQSSNNLSEIYLHVLTAVAGAMGAAS